MTGVGSGEDEKEEEQNARLDVSALNHVKIVHDAVEAIQALSILLEESGNGWLIGAR